MAKKIYLYNMTDLLNEKQNAEKQDAELQAKKARAERIKKMRGWLSPRDSVADDFGPEDASVYYGEGHSGWNR